ncbi:hypothetical protein [Spiroplasma endosymbiont of Cantharis nigra]|uniref:hypothetical protein n=1 Tax=Spiroplasma endosymbiont of Cantharis nigra TaxID=3066278 RepID=UPI0030CB787A
MKKILSILSAFGLSGTGFLATANVVSCTNDIELPEQPKSYEEAEAQANIHKEKYEKLKAEIQNEMPDFQTEKEAINWALKSTKYQETLIEATWAFAYMVKALWFLQGEQPTESIEEYEANMNDANTQKVLTSKSKKSINSIINWAKISPLS